MASAYEGDLEDLRIVLLGVSGAGKSSTANAIMGRDAFKESRTRVSEKQTGRVEDRNISIIDTPGFFNTQLTEKEMKNQIMKSLYLSDPGPHVFLLVINLETFREEQRNLVEQIQENFGEEALKFTMVLFIGRDKISRRELNQIKESKDTQKILKHFDDKCYVLNSKNECDPYQITKLLKKINEMVKNNGEQHFSNENYLKTQTKLREQMDRIKQEVVKERQEERDTQEQKREINTEVDIKEEEEGTTEDNEGEQEDAIKEKDCLRIVILGKTGSGKSSTANTILGRDAFGASFLSSTHICEKQEAVVFGRSISIIDTPGLLDSRWYRHFQDELKGDIEKCLDMSAPGPHAFLLVIRLNGRSTEREKNTVKWIQENFGEEAVRYTFVVFTHVDLLMDESLDQYVGKNPDLQSLVNCCSGRFHSFNSQDRDNQNQVIELLEKIKQLIKVNGGEHYGNEKCRKAQEKMKQENSQAATERQRSLHGLHRDHLFRLMVGLEMSEMALRLSLERALAESNLSKQDLRIVLLGFLGSGKSSTGNTILGRDAFISEIEKSLEMSAPGPHVFLLVIGMEGLARMENNPVKWFHQKLENDALHHTIVLVTHAGLLNLLIDEPMNEYIKKTHNLKSLIDSCGGRYHLLDNWEKGNHFQVTVLLLKINEIVQRNGGGHYAKQNIFKRTQKAKPLNTKQQDTGDCEIL